MELGEESAVPVSTAPPASVSQVLPWLSVCSRAAAQAAAAAGAVTHVLALLKAPDRDAATAPGVSTLVLELPDTSEARLAPLLPAALQFLAAARAEKGRVLVHCHAGQSRSPALVMAWLMVAEGFPRTAAVDFVSERHPPTRPNPSFLEQLKELEPQRGAMAQALGVVLCSPRSPLSPPLSPVARRGRNMQVRSRGFPTAAARSRRRASP